MKTYTVSLEKGKTIAKNHLKLSDEEVNRLTLTELKEVLKQINIKLKA